MSEIEQGASPSERNKRVWALLDSLQATIQRFVPCPDGADPKYHEKHCQVAAESVLGIIAGTLAVTPGVLARMEFERAHGSNGVTEHITYIIPKVEANAKLKAARPYVSPLERNVRYCLSGESDVVQCREAVRTLWALILKMNEDAKAMAKGKLWSEVTPEIFWKAQCDAACEGMQAIIENLYHERDEARGAATTLSLKLGDAQIENYSLTRERDALAKTLRFYRSCDAVEDDGKRATEVLARLESGDLRSKCPVCGWPLASTAKEGCVPGNCSYRGSDPAQKPVSGS